jgi:hypothetical protein
VVGRRCSKSDYFTWVEGNGGIRQRTEWINGDYTAH